MGAIISAILEKLSQAHESETTFEYVSRFCVLDKVYHLTPYKAFMKLSVQAEP